MKTLIKYDIWYLLKTSKFLVIGLFGIILAMFSAVMAKYYYQIIAIALRQEGIDFDVPESTVIESYNQFFSNFTELYLLVLVFIAVAFFTHDRTKGHFAIIFSKPLKRTDFLLSKSILLSVTILISLISAMLFFGLYTWILFGAFSTKEFILACLGYYIFVMMILHTGLLASTLFRNFLGPIVFTLILLFMSSLITLINQGIFKYNPFHLRNYPLQFMHGEVEQGVFIMTQFIGVVFVILLLLGSIRLFKNKALN